MGRNMCRRAYTLNAVSVLVTVVLLPSCQDSRRVKAALPARPPVVTVTMDEYHYDYERGIPAGRVVFRFVNTGLLKHRPSLLPLNEEIPPIDQQLRGENRAVVTPFAGVGTTEPGEVSTFAVDLIPGQRYALVCFADDPDGEPHRLQGMNSEFRAGEVIREEMSRAKQAPAKTFR